MLSLAAALPFSVPAGERVVRVTVRGRSASVRFDAAETVVVAVAFDPARRQVELFPLDFHPIYD